MSSMIVDADTVENVLIHLLSACSSERRAELLAPFRDDRPQKPERRAMAAEAFKRAIEYFFGEGDCVTAETLEDAAEQLARYEPILVELRQVLASETAAITYEELPGLVRSLVGQAPPRVTLTPERLARIEMALSTSRAQDPGVLTSIAYELLQEVKRLSRATR